jgi:hypothetical protein
MAAFPAFAVLGFFTSLAPIFLSGELGIGSIAIGGLIVFAVFAASGSVQLLFRRLPDRGAITFGVAVIPVALLLIVLALRADSLPLFVAGVLAGGAGSGLAFMGSLTLINRLAPPADRAGTVSAYSSSATSPSQYRSSDSVSPPRPSAATRPRSRSRYSSGGSPSSPAESTSRSCRPSRTTLGDQRTAREPETGHAREGSRRVDQPPM